MTKFERIEADLRYAISTLRDHIDGMSEEEIRVLYANGDMLARILRDELRSRLDANKRPVAHD